MKWPLGNGGASYLNDVTDTVQTVQYSDSQCTVHICTHIRPQDKALQMLGRKTKVTDN